MDRSTAYDTDIVTWAEQQAAALRDLARTRRDLSNELDLENVAEEVEDMGRAELFAVRSYIRQILVHVIKAASAPDSDALPHWRKEVVAFHNDLLDRMMPSMARRIDLGPLWLRAIKEADATLAIHGRSISPTLPADCPLTVEELVDSEFDLDRGTARVARHADDANPSS